MKKFPTVLAGTALVNRAAQKVDHFDLSPPQALAIVWNYIRTRPDPALRSNLRTALRKKLDEIEKERICATGMIERIIDTPTAIDFSLTDVSIFDIRDELRSMAAKVNEEYEMLLEHNLTLLNPSDIVPMKEAITREMQTVKRDRFLHQADVEFSIIRGFPRKDIRAEAERIFPEGMMF